MWDFPCIVMAQFLPNGGINLACPAIPHRDSLPPVAILYPPLHNSGSFLTRVDNLVIAALGPTFLHVPSNLSELGVLFSNGHTHFGCQPIQKLTSLNPN